MSSNAHSDSDFSSRLAEAIETANVPTLLMVLTQLTGDRRWLSDRYRPTRPQGMDDNDGGGLDPHVAAEIREAALLAIIEWHNGRPSAIPAPDAPLLREMLSVSMSEPIPEQYGPLLEDQFRAASPEPATSAPPGFRVLVIGAGMSGLCAGYYLDRAGIDFEIVEKASDLGGTWRDNTYPGAGVDTPSHLYSFSFAPHDWENWFSLQSHVKDYMSGVADAFDLRTRTRFGTEVAQVRYVEPDQCWEVTFRSRGGSSVAERYSAVISAVGLFNPPVRPAIPGLERFRGPCVHTAEWPNDLDLADKDLAVIGSGASAMQLVPAVAGSARSITVYQRSPQWVLPFPKFHQRVPDSIRWLMSAVPVYAQWYRARLGWTFNDKLHPVLQIDPSWSHPDRSINAKNDRHREFMTQYIIDELGDDVDRLLDRVLPTYPPYGKRILLDNGWFRTLRRDDVEVVTDRIEEIDDEHVITDDGHRRRADVLVTATGFDVTRFLSTYRIIDRHGRVLEEQWGDDGAAFLGTVVPGLPNFFCLYGPNLQPGHGGSILFTFERQMHYVVDLLRQMFDRHLGAVEIRQSVHDEYNRETHERLSRTVWTHPGMSTYYRNSRGRIVVNSPYQHSEWWAMTERADLTMYHIEPVVDRASGEASGSEGRRRAQTGDRATVQP